MNKRISLFILIILTLSLFGSSPAPVNAITWWDSDWSYKMKITINATKVDADLTDFPVLVYLNSSRIDWAHVQDDLDDLTFTDSTETVILMAELENYTVNNEAWVWVKMPTIDDAVNTDFYLYYGNSVCSSYWNPEDVWEDSAVMVQHMTDNPDNAHVMDSTQYDNDGTKTGANEPIETTSGKIDSAQSFDGNDDYITASNSISLTITDDLTLSSWIKISTYSHAYNILAKEENPNFKIQYQFRMDGTTGFLRFIHGDNDWYDTVVGDVAVPKNQSVYVVVIRSTNNIQFYINSEDAGSGTITKTPTGTGFLYLGARSDFWGIFQGILDEARIYNEAKSAEWILADYNSGADTLLIYGVETIVPLVLTVRYNIGINKLYVNGTQRANNTTIYIDRNTNVNVTAISQSNYIFYRHILGLSSVSLVPMYLFNMTQPFTLWSYATPNFYIYEEPTTFTFSQWMILLFIALGISLLAAIKFHIIATVSFILVIYMVINVASFTGMILLAIIVWLLTIMFSIIAFAEI